MSSGYDTGKARHLPIRCTAIYPPVFREMKQLKLEKGHQELGEGGCNRPAVDTTSACGQLCASARLRILEIAEGGHQFLRFGAQLRFGIRNAFSACASTCVLMARENARCLPRARNGPRIVEVILLCEVRMQFIRSNTVRSGSDVISGILNCVCPECGGRMGERGKEFRCQGECLTDWRQAWDQASAELGPRSRRAARRI
jgi:hypothetical protein